MSGSYESLVAILIVTAVALASPVSGTILEGDSCNATVFPCLRTRYVDLILDFVRDEDTVAMGLTTRPQPSPHAAPSSVYAESLTTQKHFGFLQSLCLRQSNPMRPVEDEEGKQVEAVDGAYVRVTPTAATLAELRGFADYQNRFASQAVPLPSEAVLPVGFSAAARRDVQRRRLSSDAHQNDDEQRAPNPAPRRQWHTLPPAASDGDHHHKLFRVQAESNTTTTTTGLPATVTPATTTAAPLTSSPSPTAGPAPVGSLLNPLCTIVSLSEVNQGRLVTLPFSNATAAALASTPGVRLLPFRGHGGALVLPYGTTQFLATVAVVTTGAAFRQLVQTWQQFTTTKRSVNSSSSAINFEVGQYGNFFSRTIGLRQVFVLDVAAYESLYFSPPSSTSYVGLFDPVGFGAPNSQNLSVPWILLLVVATCLFFGILYAVYVRRTSEETARAAAAARNEVDELTERAYGDDDEPHKDPGDDDDDVSVADDGSVNGELEHAETEKITQHNLATVWKEPEVHQSFYAAVQRKVQAQRALAENAAEGDETDNVTLDGGGGRRQAASGKPAGASAVVQVLHDMESPDRRRLAGVSLRRQSGFARVQLLPSSSLFEEAFETAVEYSLPPEHGEDETAFQRRVTRMQQRSAERRRKELEAQEELLAASTAAAVDVRGGVEALAAGGAVSSVSSSSAKRKAGLGGLDESDAVDSLELAELPPESSADHRQNGDAQDGTSLDRDEQRRRDGAGADSDLSPSKPIGLAARRMATMMSMSNTKFAAVPIGVLRLPSQNEILSQLRGGSAASHMAMAGSASTAADQLTRTRFSKLYFAPQALLDQHQGDSDSETSSGSASPVASDPVKRYQQISQHLENGSPSPPATSSPSNRGGRAAGSGPPTATTSKAQVLPGPQQQQRGAANTPTNAAGTSAARGKTPPTVPLQDDTSSAVLL